MTADHGEAKTKPHEQPRSPRNPRSPQIPRKATKSKNSHEQRRTTPATNGESRSAPRTDGDSWLAPRTALRSPSFRKRTASCSNSHSPAATKTFENTIWICASWDRLCYGREHTFSYFDPEYMCRYIPLNRVNALVSDSDASPNCSFPSLSECDEIGKLTSTSLMCCNIGSLEAAVKVRTIDITGASADEVRSFEFSCLEEVRMLSVLKHPCIVEFYGHRISSKWSLAADGDSGVRSLKSATFMEFIKGGSLRGTISFGIGFFFVIIGWPIIGIIIEAYGFVVLFSGFWPTLAVFLQKIPVVGWLFQQPIVRSFFDRYRGKRVPV